MEKFQDILGTVRNFLSYKIFESENIDITVGTLMAVIVAVILATYLLKLIHKLVTAKLPEEDKNKFVSIFGFFKVPALHIDNYNGFAFFGSEFNRLAYGLRCFICWYWFCLAIFISGYNLRNIDDHGPVIARRGYYRGRW